MNRKKLKILLVYDVSYPHVEGGGQRRLYEIARRLAEEGHEISWLCFKTWSGEADVIISDCIKYIGIPGFKGLYRRDGSRRRMEPIEFLVALFKSKTILNDYNIVWSGQWPIIHLFWLLTFSGKLSTVRLVVDWWEVWGLTWFKYSKFLGLIGYFLEKYFINLISSRGDLILISPASYFLAKNITPDGNFWLIQNGIDLRSIQKVTAYKESKFDLIYFGRLKDHKRVDLLLDALAILKKTYSITLSAAIVGDGPEMKNLVDRSRQLSLSSDVRFFGSIPSSDHVYSILKSSKIFVNPSIKEGGGSITLFESFACGIPVIAFLCKDGIDPSLFGDFVNDCLCRSVSSSALAERIFNLISKPTVLESLQYKVRAEAEKYDWNLIKDQYLSIFLR